MKLSIPLLLLSAFWCTLQAQTYLSPLDFGLATLEHGMIDYCNTPSNILCGNFNEDDYPDIARFNGNVLEIFIFTGKGYSSEPQQSCTLNRNIKSMRLDDNIYDGVDNLVVISEDNTEQTFNHIHGCLNLNKQIPEINSKVIPYRINEADFNIIWESDSYPFGIYRCTVGDLDNDGIIELVTFWKESEHSNQAYIVIYKCTGNDEYTFYMEEPVRTIEPCASLSQLMIGDIDQNGQKELIYTLGYTYFWEFSEPGVYRFWHSDFMFPRLVKDVTLCDTDQDSILEIAAVTSDFSQLPPTAYIVEEYGWKNEIDSTIYFNGMFTQYQDWVDAELAVGDFDNDGVMDIVSGNFGYVINYDPVETQYFRYDPGSPGNFSQNWLETGIPLRCATPVIADMDKDGDEELYAGGLYPNGGSAFVWEATGYETGYVSWLDTITSPTGPSESDFGYIDYHPSVVAIHILPNYPDDSQMLLWSFSDNAYSNLWQSTIAETSAYFNPIILDLDSDGKKDIAVAAKLQNKLQVWEQISAGIGVGPSIRSISTFQLYNNYPNPFNSSTIIPFKLLKPSNIRLTIHDITGRPVFLYKNENLKAGHHSVEWNAIDQASGLYIIALTAGEAKQIRKGVLLK